MTATATTSGRDSITAALEDQFGLADRVVDETALANSVGRFRERRIVLPTFAELAEPWRIAPELVGDADRSGPDVRNLWRLHWYNDLHGDRVEVPEHVVLPKALTGIDSPIVVVLGDRFPMITAHKVLAAYACLAPRIVTGQFDPTVHRAIWPSTGNYARGGIAISRLMASRGVAILPQGMSRERFDWLDRWCENPAEDVIRTVGTESNVKEIYDACNALAEDPTNFVFNQFCEFGNHLGHLEITGRALEDAFLAARTAAGAEWRLAAFVSATGSAGTIAAGDRLKERLGSITVAVEALECPTMLENGFGEHNIQGIGDKHIPLIHNVTNTDVVVGISDRATDELDVLFNTPAGRGYLADRKGVEPELIAALEHFGFSSICNVLAAIKTAKLLGYGPDDVIVTVATDGAAMYPSERAKTLHERFGGTFDHVAAAEVFGQHLADVDTSATLDCTERDRNRIFNLGYYTWVEQQGTPFELFEARRAQGFWRDLRRFVTVWDEMIAEFNAAHRRPVVTVGLRCAVCGASVDIAIPFTWRCPNATTLDRHHALRFTDVVTAPVAAGRGPFQRSRSRLAWDAFAAANGMSDAARAALVDALDEPLGFAVTPFARHDALSAALGFTDAGGVWLKDETGQVGGSHKARHLFTILLHLRAAELLGLAPWRERPPLAIASCGNAAIAAATLARSVDWPIDVFVPAVADEAVLGVLGSLGAQIVPCPRRPDDPPGDPCVHRFREAVADGAVPFSVQGTENVWCLDGGRTIGWEMADAGTDLDRLFVQVGGGALAACAAAGLPGVRLHAVQTGASAPLVRAWARADDPDRLAPAARWSSLMWPWEHVGVSAADGILDDETYDWIPVVEAMAATGGGAVEVDEPLVRRAHELVADHTDVDASATGTAGLAGVLATRGAIADDERVAVILSGVRRA